LSESGCPASISKRKLAFLLRLLSDFLFHMPPSPRLLLALSSGLVALSLAGCGKNSATRGSGTAANTPQKQPVEVVAVERRDLVEALSLVGSLAANETAQIRAEIAGQ